jgi:hypothetical protein
MPSGHFLKARLKKDFLSYVTIWMATRILHLSETRSGGIPIMATVRSNRPLNVLAQGTEMARVFMLVVSGAILLLAQFNNGFAAGGGGPFDGHRTGSASSTVEQCKSAKVTLTVEGIIVIGQAQFSNDAPKINGTVREDGSFGATIGWQPLVGRFSADGFEGTFKNGDCGWEIHLQRAQSVNINN